MEFVTWVKFRTYSAFMETYKGEMTCCLETIVDHHRKHGVTEENKQRIIAAVNKIMKLKGEHLLEIEKLLIGVLVTQRIKQVDKEKSGVFEITRSLSIEQEAEMAERLKICSGTEQSYEEALNRLLEIAEKAY